MVLTPLQKKSGCAAPYAEQDSPGSEPQQQHRPMFEQNGEHLNTPFILPGMLPRIHSTGRSKRDKDALYPIPQHVNGIVLPDCRESDHAQQTTTWTTTEPIRIRSIRKTHQQAKKMDRGRASRSAGGPP